MKKMGNCHYVIGSTRIMKMGRKWVAEDIISGRRKGAYGTLKEAKCELERTGGYYGTEV